MTIKLPTPGHTMKKSLQKAGKIVGIACVVFVSIESTLTWIIHQQHQQLPPYTSTAATRRLRKLPVEEIGSISTSSSKQFQARYSNNRPQTVRQKQSPAKNAVYPNVLYVGAPKAGTTAVSEWLFLQKENGHGVCHAKLIGNEPSYTPKEVHHFDHPERFEKGKGFYAEHFKHCHDASLVIDATPAYLSWADRIHEFYKETVENKSLLKDLKIMVTLRDPVARELSWYNHMLYEFLKTKDSLGWYAEVTKNGKILSFDEYVDQVLIPNLSDPDNERRFSRYAQYLKEWFELFDRDQILVLSYEETKTNIE